ncbi:MAG TPA: radical SAM protein [Methanomicrobiales archaeon]|jgi:biotin synthase-related radical SAM superfamily protein|nr:radical SAM protein [Methanomicrobiales archaeon]
MDWKKLKAELLAANTVRLEGEPCTGFISRSTAGPTAGGEGSIFFSTGGHRVRLSLHRNGRVILRHHGGGKVTLRLGDIEAEGTLEPAGLHCPRQAYVNVSEGCIFRCRYCTVPALHGKTKDLAYIEARVREVLDRVDGIAITSGVSDSIEEEERRVLAVVERLIPLGKPVGVSIYPARGTPQRLHDLGVAEVKWNLEAATPELFAYMCPGLDYEAIWKALQDSVELFGKGNVYSNVIFGLGETDEELESCIDDLAASGVIPVLRPLNPSAELTSVPRPTADRILRVCDMHGKALRKHGLDTGKARTMCTACTGCDLVPGRDT